jgi:hypothetical protein
MNVLHKGAVFVSEVMGYTPSWVKTCFAKRQRGTHLHMSRLIADGDREELDRTNRKNNGPMYGSAAKTKEVELATMSSGTETHVDPDTKRRYSMNPLDRADMAQEMKTAQQQDNLKQKKETLKLNRSDVIDSFNSVQRSSEEPKKKSFGQAIVRTSVMMEKYDLANAMQGKTTNKQKRSKSGKKKKGRLGKNKNKNARNIKKNDDNVVEVLEKVDDNDKVEIHIDPKTKRRYSYNKNSGQSDWLDQDKNEDDKEEEEKEQEEIIIHTDPKTKRRYSYNKKSNKSDWLDEENKEVEGHTEPESLPTDSSSDSSEWNEHVDPVTGRRYSSNSKSGAVKWVDPEDADEDKTWQTMMDPDSRKNYYVNNKTGRTTWTNPGEE